MKRFEIIGYIDGSTGQYPRMKNKAEAMKEDAIDSQLPLAYIEGVCIQTDIDSV